MADKAVSAASIKKLQIQLEQELEQIRAARKAAVQAKKEAIRQEHEQRGTKLQQYKAARVQLVRPRLHCSQGNHGSFRSCGLVGKLFCCGRDSS
jgi:hypothetical protein